MSLGRCFLMNLSRNTTTVHNHTNETEMYFWMDSKWAEFVHQMTLWAKVMIIFIAIITILGNTLVLFATWKERRLHQPSKYFIACLAAADLLVGIFVAPIAVYQLYLDRYTSTISIHLCRFMVWMDTFAFTVSISTLTFISFDRYFKIAKPFRYRSQMTTATSLKIIFIIAFIAIALSTFSATSYSGSTGFIVTDSMMCPVDRDKENVFYICLSIGAFFVPSTLILIMYASIFIVARKRQKMLRNGELGQTFNNQNMRISTFRQDLKVIRMLFIVVGLFIFCWGPFFIWAMMESFYPVFIDNDNNSLNYWYRMRIFIATINTLPFLNSVCNPVIYAWLDQTYRESFQHIFQRKRPTKPKMTISTEQSIYSSSL